MTTNADTNIRAAITAALDGGFLRETLDVLTRNAQESSDYRDGHLTGYVEGRLAGQQFCPPLPLAPLDAEPVKAKPRPERAITAAQPVTASTSTRDILVVVTEITAGVTGYSTDMLDPGLDLERDLGLDEAKQEKVLAAVLKEWSLDRDGDLQALGLRTLNQVAGWVADIVKARQ